MPDRSISRRSSISCQKKAIDSEQLREFIIRSCLELISDERVLGVAASYRSARVTANSDIDVLVLAADAPNTSIALSHRCLNAIPIDAQWVDGPQLIRRLEDKFVDLKTLREVGRLSTSLMIWERDNLLSRIRRMATQAALAPSEAAVLFLKSEACLRAAADDTSFARSVQNARGAAYALSTAAIATTSTGYAKPKWLFDTLLCHEFDVLADILSTLLGLSAPPNLLGPNLEPVRDLILILCAIMHWPSLERAQNEESDYANVYRTFRDAMSLLEAGHLPDAMVAADIALRLCEVAANAEMSEMTRANELLAWSAAKEILLEKQCSHLRRTLPSIIVSLNDAGSQILERYKRQVATTRALAI